MWMKILQDSRTIYTIMIIVIIVPFLVNINQVIPVPPMVREVFNYMEKSHQEHKPVIISFDFDATVQGECRPMAMAMLRHAFATRTPVIAFTFLPTGVNLATGIIDKIVKEFNDDPEYIKKHSKLEYGRDWVWLGWSPQYDQYLIAMGHDINGTWGVDANGTPLEGMPIMDGVKDFDNIGLTTTIAGSSVPEDWIAYTLAYKPRLAVGTTAVSATQYLPYMQARQIVGFIPGQTGAAAYERLLVEHGYWKTYGDAGMMSPSQSATHIVIILFIAIGNIAYFVRKSKAQ
jgi:hypothetical protein